MDNPLSLSLPFACVYAFVTLELDFENYKIVVQVTIGQLRGQGGRITSRCLWDKDNDNFVSVSVKNVLSLFFSFKKYVTINDPFSNNFFLPSV
jgi:hypothetical protein